MMWALWYINTTGLAITLNESWKGSASPFIPPQWLWPKNRITSCSRHYNTIQTHANDCMNIIPLNMKAVITALDFDPEIFTLVTTSWFLILVSVSVNLSYLLYLCMSFYCIYDWFLIVYVQIKVKVFIFYYLGPQSTCTCSQEISQSSYSCSS